MARNHEVRVTVSDKELEVLKKKAKQMGTYVSTMLRDLGLQPYSR